MRVPRAESWVTILVGVLLVREGAGAIVSSCQARVPFPFFGFSPSASLYAVIALATGVLSLLGGYWYVRLNVRGLYLAATLGTVGLLSTAVSWELLGPAVKDVVAARRAARGQRVRPGEAEFMQTFIPTAALLYSSLTVCAALASYGRFARARDAEDATSG